MSQYIKGLVSVIMPTYKRSEKLIRAIDSVLNQTYRNLELLLVNDNEPNDSFTTELQNKISKYRSDPRFLFIMQERHTNGAVARNVGIKQARGEYIAFLDDDDWWKENKIEKQVAVLSSLSLDWGGVSCKIEQYNNNQLIARSQKYCDGYIYKDILLLLSDVATGTLLLKHTALDAVGYFDEALLRHQDLQLLVNFTYKYQLKEVDEYLHCCDVSDAQNRLNVGKLIGAKKAFFESVMPVMNTLSLQEQKCIYAMHDLELGYVMFRSGQKIGAIKLCMKLLRTPKALLYASKKVANKLQMKNL